MAANYAAFRKRRALLELHQPVSLDALPWVQAVGRYRSAGEDTVSGARATLARLSGLALEAFPATIVPNPLVTELRALADEAQLSLPLVEELAADIFMGRFSAKFVLAAQEAARMLQGSLYERYYGIDYAAVLAIDDLGQDAAGVATSPSFDALCAHRAGQVAGRDSAATSMVIEQAQILTTHNLAVLTGRRCRGEEVRIDWQALARRAFEGVVVLAGQLRGNPKPLRIVKALAYAWRQSLFFVSPLPAAERGEFLFWARATIHARPPHVAAVLSPVLNGLRHVLGGGTFDAQGASEHGRRLLGSSAGPHWLLEAADL